jgi:hypothetical protein
MKVKLPKFKLGNGAYFALVAVTVLLSVAYVSFQQGAKQDKYFGPNSCRSAFTTIADQLDGSKDATASAIRGLDGVENKDAEIKRLVQECLGELPELQVPVTTVKK